MYSDEKSVHALLQKVLGYSHAEQTEVVYLATESALTRFANNFIHQNVAEKNHELRVRAIVGKRTGVATTNRLDDQSLQRVAEQALEIARLSPENPEFHSLPGPQPIVPAPGFSERTALYSPEARARSVGTIIQLAKERGLESAGAFSTETSQVAVANSLGIFAYEPRTESECHAVVMADAQGSGYTQPLVTIYDDGHDPAGVPQAFDYEGMPKQHVVMFDHGVANAVVYDSFTAFREGKTDTGHALPAPNSWGPLPLHTMMESGDASLEELIRGVERGIYVTRFHYTNTVHPVKTLFTGMTRDGTFLIEHGELTSPVKNFRFTQSILDVLRDVQAIGSESIQCRDYIPVLAPALRASSFHFTGVTGS